MAQAYFQPDTNGKLHIVMMPAIRPAQIVAVGAQTRVRIVRSGGFTFGVVNTPTLRGKLLLRGS